MKLKRMVSLLLCLVMVATIVAGNSHALLAVQAAETIGETEGDIQEARQEEREKNTEETEEAIDLPDDNYSKEIEEEDNTGSSVQNYSSKASTSSGFVYESWSTGIKITGYKGSESELVIPNQIAGYEVLFIDLNDCKLKSLDVSNCQSLILLYCRSELEKITLNNPRLDTINIRYNKLTSLDVSKCPSLRYLDCWGNNIKELDVSACKAMLGLDCSSNPLATLNLKNNSLLTSLNCNDCKLTTLNISQNAKLERLSCASNKLTSLNLTNNTKLEDITCSYNKLSELNTSKNTYLGGLDCSGNKIEKLNLEKNTKLGYLLCQENSLEKLDISKNKKLTALDCSYNYINNLTNLKKWCKTNGNIGNISSQKNIIRFYGNGSTSGSMSNLTFWKGKTQKLTNNTFKRKGYQFNGWNTKANGKGTKYKNQVSVKDKNLKLYAQWKKNTYKITYKLNSGNGNKNNPTSYTVTSKTITLKEPTRQGYTFAGWYKDAKYTKKVAQIKKGSTGNLTLYAKWVKKTYTVKFKGNGSTSGSMSDFKLKYDVSGNLTANNFKRMGYTFKNWNTKADGTGTSYKNKASIKNKNLTLYAQWAPNTYKVSFLGNGDEVGTTMGVKTYKYGTSYTLPKNTYSLANYTFAGWNTKVNGAGISYANKETVKNLTTSNNVSIPLYAQWKYTVKYDKNANDAIGTVSSTTLYKGRNGTLASSGFQRTGYDLVRWSTKAGGKGTVYNLGQSVSITPKDGSVTLYAVWEEKTGIEKLREKFPDGSYWNHVAKLGHGTDRCETEGCNDPDKVTDQPCKGHGVIVGIGEYDCNSFNQAIQCKGFAYKLAYDLYGSQATSWNTITGNSGTDLMGQLKPGDVLVYMGSTEETLTGDGHTVMIIGVNENYISVAECNYGNTCQIGWDRQIDLSTISKVTVYLAPEMAE